MVIRKSRLPLLICGAAICLVSCQKSGPGLAASATPPQAMAPAATATRQKPAPQPASTAAAAPAAAPQPDALAALIAQAEDQYQQGQASRLAGAPEAAEQSFENALEALSGAADETGGDPRLEAERDKITQARSQLELEAPVAAADASGPPAQPAPIDEVNDASAPVDPQVKARAEAELKTLHSDLPLVMNDYVAGYINYFTTRGRGVLQRALVRAGRYRGMIESTFTQAGIPRDLIYLAQAESGFQPLALSREGARGMWQFMASRGRAYGLERNRWIDQRQDPEKSTQAAARHLKDLYNQFGDWYLAMAAYNSGPVNVQQAVARTGFADFWQLYQRDVLPPETRNYVPIILAMTIIAKNPAQYGFSDIQPDAPLAVDHVQVDYPLDLRLAAECVRAPLATIQELNPSLLRLATPRDESFELNLPPNTGAEFEQAMADIPRDKRLWWRYHTLQPGQNLASVARHYKVRASAITAANGLQADEIGPGTRLLIPLAANHYAPGERTRLTYARHPTRYRVLRGDTVSSVAADFGVPESRLRAWNRLQGNYLRPGRRLVIYRPLEVAVVRHPAPSHPRKRKRAGAKPPAPHPAGALVAAAGNR